jgi:hypothetical protein
MANPFSIFQRNQRVWMAVLVFISIIAFVVSPAIQSFTSPTQGRMVGGDRSLASWTGGSVSVSQLEREYQNLLYSNQFLRKLAEEVVAKGGTPNVPVFSEREGLYGITRANNLEQILQRKFLVTEAERRGITFNEESVTQFLKQFVDRKLDGVAIRKMYVETTKMPWVDFNQTLCEEFAKIEMLKLSRTSFQFQDRRESKTLSVASLTTPSRNWQEFLKFNQKATIQAFPVFAKDFESEVNGSPSEREAQDIYKEGRTVTKGSSNSPVQPAFLPAWAADFEYIAIDTDKITQAQMALIPEATLRAEYEKGLAENKYRVPVTPTKQAVGEGAAEGTSTPSSTPEATGAPASPEPSTPSPSAGTPETPSSTAEQGSTPDATQPSSPEVPVPAVPTPATVPDVPAPVLPGTPEKPTAFQALDSKNIKLISFQEETPAVPAIATTTPPIVSQEPAAPAGTQPTAEGTAVTTDQPNSIELSDEPIAKPTQDGGVPSPDLPAALRIQTFEEAKEQIARGLAGPESRRLSDQYMERIIEPMMIYHSEFNTYQQMVAQKEKNPIEPKRLNVQELAEKFGFEYGLTGRIDAETGRLTPLGMSFVMGGPQRFLPFDKMIDNSQETSVKFYPNVSQGFLQGSVRYIFWKIDETVPVPPTIETVRDEIKSVWIKQQAFKLAETRAKDLASKVGSSSLTDSLVTAEEKSFVQEPTPFTWLSPMFNQMQGQSSLGIVELLQPINGSFMEAVFGAEPGSTIAMSDANKTIYYVIKVVALTPDSSELLEKFSSTSLEGVAMSARQEVEQAGEVWFRNLQKQLGYRSVSN